MTAAMETVFGRHVGEIRTAPGIYAAELGPDGAQIQDVRQRIARFATTTGRPPRILVAKVGQDGHDRGQKVIASAFADFGFEVVVGPLFATPAEIAALAIEKDVDVVGVSSLAAGHLTLVPQLKSELEGLGRANIMIVIGGVIPAPDYAVLEAAGAAAVFGPGTIVGEAALDIVTRLNRQLGQGTWPQNR